MVESELADRVLKSNLLTHIFRCRRLTDQELFEVLAISRLFTFASVEDRLRIAAGELEISEATIRDLWRQAIILRARGTDRYDGGARALEEVSRHLEHSFWRAVDAFHQHETAHVASNTFPFSFGSEGDRTMKSARLSKNGWEIIAEEGQNPGDALRKGHQLRPKVVIDGIPVGFIPRKAVWALQTRRYEWRGSRTWILCGPIVRKVSFKTASRCWSALKQWHSFRR